jgi:hypothetical protein
MSAAVKRALRAAREALGAKDYHEAIAACKGALKEDARCFEAYL